MAFVVLELRVFNLLSNGQVQPALELACAGLEIDPGNAELCNLAGSCAFQLGDAVQAEQFWIRATRLNPDNAQPYFNLGILHEGAGCTDKAEECYRLAIKLNSNDADALVNLGTLLLRLRPGDEAEQCLRRAISIAPENALAYSNLGIILAKSGRAEEAERVYRKAVSLDAATLTFRLNLANFLTSSIRNDDIEEAKSLFLEVIKAEPGHYAAWNNLGRLLFETGYKSAAHTAFTAAVTYHPGESAARVNLANVLLDRGDLSGAEEHFKVALEINSDLDSAHQGLASILHRQGHESEAAYQRDLGFGKHPVSSLAYRGNGTPLQLLVLASALEGNIPWRFLIDCAVFQTTIIAVEYFDIQAPLPAHQLIFNAIGDADLCQHGLNIANRLIMKSAAPVINRPEAVLQTGRLNNAGRLGLLSGVLSPRMALVSKSELLSGRALESMELGGLTFPLLFRSPSFHGGNYFVKVDSQDALNSSIDGLPGDNLLAIEFLDPGSGDGLFRKFRVMAINGHFYPIHLAVSTQWKVHYFSSDMEENEKYRAEEDAFLSDFRTFLGQDVISVLDKIRLAIGLDYCGMDFGLDKQGNILLYEANSTMQISPPTHESYWDYKRPAVKNALTATQRMFAERGMVR